MEVDETVIFGTYMHIEKGVGGGKGCTYSAFSFGNFEKVGLERASSPSADVLTREADRKWLTLKALILNYL